MFYSVLTNKRGMALLLVISLISILAMITLQFSRNMRQEYVLSTGLHNSTLLNEINRSGVAIGQQMLHLDQAENDFDSLHDSWALLEDETFDGLFESGTLKVTIDDESGKFPINALVIRKRTEKKKTTPEENNKSQELENNARNILWRLLREEPFFVEDGKAREIIDSLIDWIDSGDGNGEEEYGAEESYYRSLSPPYSCKNGPIDSIEELLLVKGISRELLYGTDETPPLAPLLTAMGDDGKININSAPLPLLDAIVLEMDKNSAEILINYRENRDNREQLRSPEWYQSVPSFPEDIAAAIQKQGLTTVTSTFFTITATAVLHEQRQTIAAIVERTDDDINVLRWDSR